MSSIQFDISRLVPKFIYSDRNGYALSKAIERAFEYVADAVEAGIALIMDVDTMPEWRLDELAHEYNCLYDYTADVEVKRVWIRDAVPLFSEYGTTNAIYRYLSGYFDEIEVEENWQYGGDPYHFRVTVSGEWNPANEAWARRAIEAAKNVRSTLDALRLGCRASMGLVATGDIKERFRYPHAGEMWAGEYPTDNIIWRIDETPRTGIEAADEHGCVPYRMAGTYPEINHTLALDGTPIRGDEADETVYTIYYPHCGDDYCGAAPDS